MQEDLLISDEQPLSIQELSDLVLSFQDQLATLDQRTSAANFGSKIYQTKETIASKGRFIAGFQDDVAIMDGRDPTLRFWAGKADPATAPFRVDKDGNMFGASVTLTGYIEDGGAAADVNANATTIAGGKITALSITASQIAAGAITATKISVSTLSAISADIGTITAGSISGITITGGTIQTASSGLRVVLSGTIDAQIKFMNGSTTYGYIFPYAFPQGNGINMETLSGDGYMYIQEGTHNAAGVGTTDANLEFLDTVATMTAAGGFNIGGPLATTVTNGHITISGNAFLRLKSMSGGTADGLGGIQNGCMYYRDDHVIRVRINGAWKSVTVA